MARSSNKLLNSEKPKLFQYSTQNYIYEVKENRALSKLERMNERLKYV